MAISKHLRRTVSKEEFLENLYHQNEDYRLGGFKIVKEYSNMYTSMLVENKYGILKVMPYTLLNNGKLGVSRAIDKSSYTLNEIKDLNPKLYPYIINIRINGRRYIVETLYGDIITTHKQLIRSPDISIMSAIDKNDFWIRRNKYIREDYKNIDYSQALYYNNKHKVKLTCKLHNYVYHQRPSHHTAGIQGCPYCMKQTIMYTEDNFKTHKDFFKNIYSFLYVIELKSDKESFYKVGITSDKRFEYRMNQFKKEYKIKVIYKERNLIEDNYKLEQQFLKEFSDYKYTPLIKFTGHTECLSINPIEAYYYYYY